MIESLPTIAMAYTRTTSVRTVAIALTMGQNARASAGVIMKRINSRWNLPCRLNLLPRFAPLVHLGVVNSRRNGLHVAGRQAMEGSSPAQTSTGCVLSCVEFGPVQRCTSLIAAGGKRRLFLKKCTLNVSYNTEIKVDDFLDTVYAFACTRTVCIQICSYSVADFVEVAAVVNRC